MTRARGVRGQGRPLPLEQRVFLELTKTQDQKLAALAALLKQHGLSGPQFNVLRILRGTGSEGLACHAVSERMLTRLPDITRLVDRLAAGGLVTRERGVPADRRCVIIHITRKGLGLLSGLDRPVVELHQAQFSSLSQNELRDLEGLLAKARGQ